MLWGVAVAISASGGSNHREADPRRSWGVLGVLTTRVLSIQVFSKDSTVKTGILNTG